MSWCHDKFYDFHSSLHFIQLKSYLTVNLGSCFMPKIFKILGLFLDMASNYPKNANVIFSFVKFHDSSHL
jgi:hypothetical protein